jgi:hypothetical protein
MTTWVITGSRPQMLAPYTEQETHNICAVLHAFFKNGDNVIQGGAKGVDSIALRYAHKRGLRTISILPRSRAFTDEATVRRFSDEIIETNLGYFERDELEVERGDKVLAFPVFERNKSSRSSGTWHTWHVAVKANKHCVLVVLRPSHGPIITGPEWTTASDALGAQLTLF